ncbi:hypothetical protein MMF93_08130 [Streptomyces tubbatahanensis]|uniref:Lipoprotein n=1 Tax=Streptomyces tubbatahanensis TaxID=2923272 RepID=A0ABY3XPT8_9ACTN|nr:hypothetical protein [Streptomyces tubbatahanensis]UNS96477.1 hypothetical protein MMF93_08130 [Streptomyces tubbatahanensis]
MNKQASTAMWTAGAVAAALLLGACGSDDDSQDEIKGAGDSKPSKSAPASKSSAPSQSEDSEIKLAKDAKNVFEDAKTDDPKKREVLADNQRRINSIDRVITTGKDVEQVALYSKGQAAISANEYILSFTKNGKSWAGVTRYYNQQVQLEGGEAAQVTFCADESKAKNKIVETGKLKPNNGGDKNYLLTSMRMERNKDGVWQATAGSETAGAEKCMG